MGSTALTRARSWTVGILSASAVATAIVGVHLAEDHAAAVAAGTNSSGSSTSSTASRPSDQSGTETQRGSGDDQQSGDGGSLFGDDGDGNGGQGAQVSPNNQNNQSSQSQNGFSSPGQLGSGSGSPQVMSRGS
ncbi:MAG TPA: hypothetical protein VFM07_08585 [Intrasporangium sp.]|nr:hypothetical protein [Intrasporangium sp.]